MDYRKVSLQCSTELAEAIEATGRHYGRTFSEEARIAMQHYLMAHLLYLVDNRPQVLFEENPAVDLDQLRSDTQARLDRLHSRVFKPHAEPRTRPVAWASN